MRLQALASYSILDTLPDDNYDAITQLAAQVCEVPISLISFIDANRLWFKSSYGLNVQELPRQDLFCEYAIRQPGQLLEVTDARLDERFVDSPLVTGAPNIVFYAGIPLTDADGHALGTLCVLDQVPRRLTKAQISALTILSRQVIMQTELRQSQHLLQKANAQLATLNGTLQANNELLQAVFDNCPAGLILWEAIRDQGRIIDFRYRLTNPANSAITGLQVEDMIGQTLLTLFPGALTSGLFEQFVSIVESRQPQLYQQHYQIDTIDFWGDFAIRPFGDGLLSTIQDITRLKETEEQLRTHTENLRHLVSQRTVEVRQLSALQNAILQHAGLAIISTDVNGQIRTVNPATETLLGYPANALIGTLITDLHNPVVLQKQARRLSQQFCRPVEPGFDVFKLLPDNVGTESVLVSRDGRAIPVLLTTMALLDETGALTGYVGMATDISALKVAKAQLEKKNRELNTFFEVALDLHCIADSNGNILKINRSWLTTMGYSASELVHTNHFDLVHPDDRAPTKEAIRQITPNQPIHNRINRFQRKDGTYRVIEWNAVLIDNLLYASARDITERQLAERQLRTANQRLQLATQAAGQGIWQWNIRQDVLTWDERLCAMHGLPAQKLKMTAQDFFNMVHPDDLTSLYASNQPNDKDTFGHVVRIITADGRIRYTETRSLLVRDKDGEPLKMIGVVWDVTEQKQADLALRQSEERYRSLVNNLNDVVFQADLSGCWTYLNPAWEAVTGYTIDESLGGYFLRYVHPDDQQRNLALFEPLIGRQKNTCRHLVRYLHKNGGFRWVESFAQLITDEKGEPTGLTGTLTDVTERKQAEDARWESDQRFREIADNVDEIFWIHQAHPLQLLYINEAYEQVFDRPTSVLYQNPRNFLEAVFEEDRAETEAAFLHAYHQGLPLNLQYRLRGANGLIRWLSIRTTVVRDPEGNPLRYIGVANDITSQKEKELMLHQMLAREQELNKLKTQFVSTASHEFRTPLATIQSSVDLIGLYVDRPEATAKDAIKRHLGIIEKEVGNFTDLLADILTIGKIDEGKFAFSPRQTDVLALCHSVVMTHFYDRADKRVVQTSSQGTAYPVSIDEKLLGHVIINLIANAFKFSDSDPELHISFNADQLLIAVADRGIGIPADDLPHLFQTFYRARNATTIQGTGLGLSIARQFVELHSGHLTVDSEENKGTTFIIALPVNTAAPLVGIERIKQESTSPFD